jgi:hypothetical protein
VPRDSLIFTGESVRAILRGSKTQTRRVVSAQNTLLDGGPMPRAIWPAIEFARAWVDRGPSPAGNPGPYLKAPRRTADPPDEFVHRLYPIWQRGDQAWVRETWAHLRDLRTTDPGADALARRCFYRAEHPTGLMDDDATELRWRSPIFMPRQLARITLEIESVRVERLQDIGEEDARAEGVSWSGRWSDSFSGVGARDRYGDDIHRNVAAFALAWDSINGKRASWASNPWCWVIAFKRAEGSC